MPQLIIKIKNKIAKPLNNCVICDNSDYTVKFIFDEEWEKEPLRIARFIWNKQYVDVQFTGDTCEVPVVSKTNNLAIGVYAGDLRTTTPAILTCYTSILSEDVIEHSITPSEYEEIMKMLNAQATDIAALKAVDKRIWTNLDTINKTASAAKVKAEEGVAKADDALTATRTNATNITNLQNDVTTLIDEKNTMGSRLTEAENTLNNVKTTAETNKADIETLYNEKNTIASRLTETENTLNNVKTTAETAKTKAEEALARNVFTDEEKAKLAGITNPMIIKGRVDTVEDLPTIAEIGWFYFVGLESASSYQEYCYSETGWEYVGVSQEGVDLSNYYTKAQVDSKNHTLEGKIQGNTAAIADLNKDVGDSVAGIYTEITSVKNKISPLESNVNTLIDEKNIIASRLTTAETNIKNLQGDVTELQNDVISLTDEKNIIASRLTEAENTLNSVKTTAETAETKADNALTQADSNTTSINSLNTEVTALKAVDERLWASLDTINKTASTAKTKAEEGVAKADNALTATRTNADNISTHETRLDSIDNTLSSHDTRITTAQQKANSVDEKVDSTNEVVGQLSTSLQSAYNKINAHANDIAVNKSALGYQRKNLLPYPKSIVKGGITFTCDENGYMTGSNTTNDIRQWTSANAQYSMYLEAGTYYFSSFAETVCTNSDGRAYIIANGTQIVGVSTRETHVEKMFTLSEATTIYVMAKVYDGKVAFMIREADIADDSYEPYKPSLFERCLLKDTAGINLGAVAQSSSITIDNLSSYTALWINVAGAVAGISFMTNLIVPVSYLAKSTSNSVRLAGGIPSSAYTTSEGPLAAKNMSGYITAKVNGNTLDLTISDDGTIGSVEVISLM